MSVDPAASIHTPRRSGVHARDVATVALLLGAVVFLVLPFGIMWAAVAWSVGAGLLWTSASWGSRDKALGTLVWPGGLIGPVLLLTSVGQVCTQVMQGDVGRSGAAVGGPACTGFAFHPAVGVPLSLVVIAAPIAVAVLLMNRTSTS